MWLLGIAVIGGLVLISLVRWLIGAVYEVGALAQAEPRIWVIEIVSWVFRLLMVALLVRVIGSWFGVSPYSQVDAALRGAHRLAARAVAPGYLPPWGPST